MSFPALYQRGMTMVELLVAMTVGLGVLLGPAALFIWAQRAFPAPLAAGVIGGSVSATLVTFFLLPTAYAVVERRADGRPLARQ